MEQILFLLLVGVVGLIRLLFAAAEKKRNADAARRAAPGQPNAPVQRAPASSEEERVRRFLEALGVPTNMPPPQKAPRREVTPKAPKTVRKILPVDSFPAPRSAVPPPPEVAAPTFDPDPVVVLQPGAQPTPELRPVPVAAARRTAPEFEVREIEWVTDYTTQVPSADASGALVRQDTVAAEKSWSERFAAPQGLRDAIILREIFGPPRSMQEVGQSRAPQLA